MENIEKFGVRNDVYFLLKAMQLTKSKQFEYNFFDHFALCFISFFASFNFFLLSNLKSWNLFFFSYLK